MVSSTIPTCQLPVRVESLLSACNPNLIEMAREKEAGSILRIHGFQYQPSVTML